MEIFRLCLKQFAALDGEGARLYGGRWNTAGRRLIYSSEHLSLAVLEYLVHVEPDNLPDNLIWVKIYLPDNASVEKYNGVVAPSEYEASRFGDQWIKQEKTLALIVPSVVLAVENNVLINPLHPAISSIKIVERKPFSFDRRFFKH